MLLLFQNKIIKEDEKQFLKQPIIKRNKKIIESTSSLESSLLLFNNIRKSVLVISADEYKSEINQLN